MLELSMAMLNSAVFILVGLLALFTGLTGGRLLRLWLALAGFETGYYVGLQFGPQMIADPIYQLVLAVLFGILLAGFYCIFSRVGGLLAGAGVMLLLADQLMRLFPVPAVIKIWVIVLVMLAGAALGVLHIKPFLALASAFNGAWLVSFCVGGIVLAWPLDQGAIQYNALRGPGLLLVLIGTGVLFVLGTMVQFAMLKKTAKKPVAALEADTTDNVMSDGLVLPEAPVEMTVETSDVTLALMPAESESDEPQTAISTQE